MQADVAVIGAGAAGLAAAVAAKKAGAEEVLIIDREEKLGGILPQCIHTGFGLQYFRENLTGPEYALKFIEEARRLGVKSLTNTMVLRLRPGEITAANSQQGIFTVKARAIVFAAGARERPIGAIGVPGTRPAGIYTAGLAQKLMDNYGLLPGREIVVLGSGDVGLIMARRFAMEGAKVKAVVEIMPYPGGLARNVVQCLEDWGIPLLLSHTVTRIHGRNRVEAVTIAKVDDKLRPIPGTERKMSCDALVLSVGLIPEIELLEEAGAQLDPHTGGPIVDENMETSLRGVFAAGNAVCIFDSVDNVSVTGETAGKAAALHAQQKLQRPAKPIRITPGRNVRYAVPQLVSGSRSVKIYVRVSKPLRNAAIMLGDKTVRRAPRLTPPEMVTLTLSKTVLEGLEGEVKLNVEGEEG
ncbi:MAG: pyridine nucleotide-disulfide oxidoreductase [Thermoprotei archaeon]|nr:MAG: pyridine nucleotide-disulfide oxidoreductase [Thermoprotei archaeon]